MLLVFTCFLHQSDMQNIVIMWASLVFVKPTGFYQRGDIDHLWGPHRLRL